MERGLDTTSAAAHAETSAFASVGMKHEEGLLLGRPGPGKTGEPDNTRLGPDPEPPGTRLDALLSTTTASRATVGP
jgi:hypothetical protein